MGVQSKLGHHFTHLEVGNDLRTPHDSLIQPIAMIHADFNTVLEAGDPEELTQLELAQKVGDALNKAYPNHRKETL